MNPAASLPLASPDAADELERLARQNTTRSLWGGRTTICLHVAASLLREKRINHACRHLARELKICEELALEPSMRPEHVKRLGEEAAVYVAALKIIDRGAR